MTILLSSRILCLTASKSFESASIARWCSSSDEKRSVSFIVAETDLYETDKEVQNLIDWVCLSEQIKENNNTIRNLTGEYKKIEPDCREGVWAQLERMKQLCKERNNLYEKQNDLKGQKYRIEKLLER